MEAYWRTKTFCVITGASRGIGRCIAIEFAQKVGQGSVFLLLARSLPGLESTREEILSHRQKDAIKVSIAAVDLGKPNSSEYKSLIEMALTNNENTAQDFQHAMMVQNAANLGIQSGLKIEEIDNLHQPSNKQQLRSVIQISSSGAIEPFKTWGLYCSSKAAKDMLLKSMALESGIHALNWAPGCVNTDIYEEAVQYTADTELANFFEEHRKAGKVLTCEQTVTKLMKVLAGQKYTKGEHVAYDDIPDE